MPETKLSTRLPCGVEVTYKEQQSNSFYAQLDVDDCDSIPGTVTIDRSTCKENLEETCCSPRKFSLLLEYEGLERLIKFLQQVKDRGRLI